MTALTGAVRQALADARIEVHTFPSDWTVLTMPPDISSRNKTLLGEWIDIEWHDQGEHYRSLINAAVPSWETLGAHPAVIPDHQTIILGPPSANKGHD